MQPEDQMTSNPTPVSSTETVREQDKIMLILAYLGIFALIPLLTVKDSDFVKFHARQGLVLTVVAILGVSVLGLVIPVLGGCVVSLGWIVLSVVGIVNSLKGERWRIPGLADLADKF